MATTIIFATLSVLAIIAGGLISAFSARRPTQFTAWVSAYLVLVVGIMQLGIVSLWHALGRPQVAVAWLALLIYNLGNLCVIIGTLLKKRAGRYPRPVDLGGLFLALAMLLLLMSVRHAKLSWALGGFAALVIIILVSMPIGLVLSNKRSRSKRF
jgi:hypothetical protein